MRPDVTVTARPAVLVSDVSWRQNVLQVSLRAAVLLGFLACIPSMYLAARAGLISVVILDFVILATIVVLHRRPNLPYVWRAGVFCAAAYALGLGLLLAVGTTSQIYLIASIVLTTLLLGVRAGLGVTLLSALTIVVFGLCGLVGGSEMLLAVDRFSTTRWIVIAINFGLVAALLTLGVGSVVARLEEAVTEQVRARLAHEKERALLRTFIDTVPDVVYTKDPDGRFVMVNPATAQMFGFTNYEEMQGKTVFDVYPPDVAERLRAEDVTVMAGRTTTNREVKRLDPGGRDRWYLALKAPLVDSTGAVTGLLGISRDITERKELEQQLRQAQKMEAVGQLAGGIAHDFNNLLTIIFGYSDVLRAESEASETLRDSVDAISEAAGRAAALTRQLLAFSRKAILQPQVIDVNAAISDTARMLGRLIGETIAVQLKLDPSIDTARVDPGQFDQVLMNLAVNARDAMPDGGTLTISTATVHLSDARAEALETVPGPHVQISVSDTGVGMTEAVVARIFEPFYTTKGLGTGTGLGLAMVFGIVRQSGGGIYVDSAPNEGSTFHIVLPVVADKQAVATPAPASRGVRGSETILLVEDDAGVRELAEANLRGFGYDVLTAVDGRHALAVLKSHGATIDMLVTDIVMPNMSGPELAAAVQSSHPGIRALFMSGYTDDAVVRQGLLNAEVAILQKPYTPLGLAQKVRQILDIAPPASV